MQKRGQFKMTSKAICHCGAVVVEFSGVPDEVAECNCSICRRLGALWIYRAQEEVSLTYAEGATSPMLGVTKPSNSTVARSVVVQRIGCP